MKNEIKICHLTSAHSALDDRIFLKECVSLAKVNFDVYIVAPNSEEQYINGVHIISFPFRKNRLKRFIFLSRFILKMALKINADIYHLHDPDLLACGYYLKKKGKVVIFDSHEDVPKQILSKDWIFKPFRLLISNLYREYEKKILSKFDGLITVNESIATRLLKINSNTIIITNYPLLTETNLFKVNLFTKENAICFGGNIKKEYMHHLILDAISEMKGVKYYLAGNVSQDYFNVLKNRAGWMNVEYLGFLGRVQLFEMYSKSMIGIAVHDYTPNVGGKEGSLGFIKNFEFMMAGLPVICTDFNVWKEIIEKEKCGICVNPTDKDEIKNAIQYLLTNPEVACWMGENGRKAVENRYNWETQVPILIDFYNNLCVKLNK